MKLASIISGLAFVVAAASIGEAQMAQPIPAEKSAKKIIYFPAGQVEQAFVKGMPLIEILNYKVHASHRDGPGIAEIHTRDTDIIHVLEGSALFVTGGAVVEPKTVEPEEIRGKEIRGGESRRLGKGDVIIVPNGVPHWFKEVRGPLNYYVVKVRSENGAE